MHIDGHSDSAFSNVLDVFTQLLENPEQRGASLCVQIAGETVIDVWGGVIDRHAEQLWQRDTLVNIFSGCCCSFTANSSRRTLTVGYAAGRILARICSAR